MKDFVGSVLAVCILNLTIFIGLMLAAQTGMIDVDFAKLVKFFIETAIVAVVVLLVYRIMSDNNKHRR